MVITKTPYRISFFGGGTDLPAWSRKHGGSVLSTTIDKYCYVMCRPLPPFFHHKHRIVYSKIELPNKINEIVHPIVKNCIKYCKVKGGIEIHHDGDLPAWSGMGTSSSFTVGLLNALHVMAEQKISKSALARKAIHVEQKMVKDTVGFQDQTAAAHGGLNQIKFLPNDGIVVAPISLPASRLNDFESRLSLFFTGIIRKSSNIEKEKVRNFSSRTKELHEMQSMVEPAINILKRGNFDDFGAMLHESWLLKRSLATEVSNDFIDNAYNRARKAGAIGGKLLGAGGGGFMLFFSSPENREAIKKEMKKIKFLEVPFKFENNGSQVIFNQPGQNG